MARNPERREVLVDAAIEVLAREGARGLTFRAVDTQAGVPIGTASNYFANRDDLFGHVAGRVFQRMVPDPAILGPLLKLPRTRKLEVELMRDLMDRVTRNRAGYLALLELRLEATRRPELQASLTETIRSDLETNVAFHLNEGLPGDRTTVLTLYFAMLGLIVESLTLPDVLPGTSRDDLIAGIVSTIIPKE